jgi:toxin YoeB
MEVAYTKKAKDDIAFWKTSGNKKIQTKISELITSITQTPFEGIGKPEPLKHNLAGSWSRRINQEHRIVYEVTDNKILIHSLKGHYL